MEGEHGIVFYADDGSIAWRNPIWVHMKLAEMVRMFDRVGLLTNICKTKAMVCTPDFIWCQQGKAEYKRRATGEGAKFWEIKKTGFSSKECGGTMAELSLCHQK